MTTLSTFMKEYLLDNYDDIQSEGHAEEVAEAVELYVTNTLIPEMITQYAPDVKSRSVYEEELAEVTAHGRYQERLELFLTWLYGQESVVSMLFENQDDRGEYFLARLIVDEKETEKQIKVCHVIQQGTQEDIQYYSSDSSSWFSVGELPSCSPSL
ncbi:hypothetical protein [Brevibacillus reuszeri]|uniref:hypothetical protein n=1 Tax=Brevibacillus reuszeri TaxID=54915 RepID=UPI003D1E7089